MMTRKEALYGVFGAIAGAVSMYFVMDRIHQIELQEVFEEADEYVRAVQEGDDEALRAMGQIASAYSGAEDGAAVLEVDMATDDDVHSITLREVGTGRVISIGVEQEGDGAEGGEDEEPVEDEPLQDPEDEVEVKGTAVFDGVYVIKPEETSQRLIVGKYDHDTGALEIDTKLSVANDFDEIIENDALYSLINEEAYDILMSANADYDGPARLVAVRNNVINLDFVIRY